MMDIIHRFTRTFGSLLDNGVPMLTALNITKNIAATSLIEPLIILVMGVVVGCIILAICLPIFEINQLIQ